VHHVRTLADGGSDRPENAVALCPTCHRRLHHGADAAVLRSQLYLRVGRLVQEW
jgi:5-methylcytosine-specific restriction protein A